MKQPIEILAPAGGMDSLIAAVRCGANAVYLGGAGLNARQGAENFDKTLLLKAVSYCHARGVKVHQTINTIVFDDELKTAEELIKDAADAGVDAFIIQDIGILELARKCTPEIQCHASTQMSVHNLDGVKKLAELGFSRVVLARELALEEIRYITKNSPIEVECFVHGALCMSVSGQCYFSSMVGGRSGNRGRCAQPCRLPFSSDKSGNALSLKDLSVIEYLPELYAIGVSSFKIEGRLKRPEYVAATVTACKDVLAGKTPDYKSLQSVFSRSGFTKGYIENNLGDSMFGTRTKEDVVSASGSLKELANLYNSEQPLVAVNLKLTMKNSLPTVLIANYNTISIEVEGDIPEVAISAPTTYEKAEKALSKMGNTPFYLEKLDCEIDNGIMLPASGLNNLRREALDKLLEKLEAPTPKPFVPYSWKEKTIDPQVYPKLRARLHTASQIYEGVFDEFDKIIIPISEGLKLTGNRDKIILELPHINFNIKEREKLKKQLIHGAELGFKELLLGGIDTVEMAKSLGYNYHGDFNLNIVNELSLEKYLELGFESLTMSIEYPTKKAVEYFQNIKGIVVYGKLPMMTFRNHPAGLRGDKGYLTDRLGNKFLIEKQNEVSVMYNSVPLFLADQLESFKGFGFYILYFTNETKEEVKEIIRLYKNKEKYSKDFTRGLYKGKVR